MSEAIHIWRLSDRRAGHDNQSLGLVDALARRVAVNAKTIEITSAWLGIRRMLKGTKKPSHPALIIGAGHATHGALIIGAWKYRARSIVLMNPSLPRSLFDLCIVPEHDRVKPRSNVLQSFGALNRISPAAHRDSQLALILLGGPSRHHDWQQELVMAQIRKLVNSQPALNWVIADSPRTPRATMDALTDLDGVEPVRFKDVNPQWLPARLAQASLIWVTEDSMSMAYEALSSGAPTGLLRVGAPTSHSSNSTAKSKLSAAVDALLDSGRVLSIDQWLAGQRRPQVDHEPLREADRCAQQILERWPDLQ